MQTASLLPRLPLNPYRSAILALLMWALSLCKSHAYTELWFHVQNLDSSTFGVYFTHSAHGSTHLFDRGIGAGATDVFDCTAGTLFPSGDTVYICAGGLPAYQVIPTSSGRVDLYWTVSTAPPPPAVDCITVKINNIDSVRHTYEAYINGVGQGCTIGPVAPGSYAEYTWCTPPGGERATITFKMCNDDGSKDPVFPTVGPTDPDWHSEGDPVPGMPEGDGAPVLPPWYADRPPTGVPWPTPGSPPEGYTGPTDYAREPTLQMVGDVLFRTIQSGDANIVNATRGVSGAVLAGNAKLGTLVAQEATLLGNRTAANANAAALNTSLGGINDQIAAARSEASAHTTALQSSVAGLRGDMNTIGGIAHVDSEAVQENLNLIKTGQASAKTEAHSDAGNIAGRIDNFANYNTNITANGFLAVTNALAAMTNFPERSWASVTNSLMSGSGIGAALDTAKGTALYDLSRGTSGDIGATEENNGWEMTIGGFSMDMYPLHNPLIASAAFFAKSITGWVLFVVYLRALYWSFARKMRQMMEAKPLVSGQMSTPFIGAAWKLGALIGVAALWGVVIAYGVNSILGTGNLTTLANNPMNGWTGKAGAAMNLAREFFPIGLAMGYLVSFCIFEVTLNALITLTSMLIYAIPSIAFACLACGDAEAITFKNFFKASLPLSVKNITTGETNTYMLPIGECVFDPPLPGVEDGAGGYNYTNMSMTVYEGGKTNWVTITGASRESVIVCGNSRGSYEVCHVTFENSNDDVSPYLSYFLAGLTSAGVLAFTGIARRTTQVVLLPGREDIV